MFIRKIKPKFQISDMTIDLVRIFLFSTLLFLFSFFFYKVLVLNKKPSLGEQKEFENTIVYDIGRDKGKQIQISGYVFPFTKIVDKKSYNFYVLFDKKGIKYISSVSTGDFQNKQFSAQIKGKIKNFIGDIPFIKANEVLEIKTSKFSGSIGKKISNFNKKYRDKKIDKIIYSYYSPSIRPIPKDGMDFKSQKGYTMVFPRDVFYEVILSKETFDIEGLFCDNIVLVVGRDKKKYVKSDKFYLRNHARLKIFVCEYDSKTSKTPPQINGLQYMTTPDRKRHFYIKVIRSGWKSTADKISVINDRK